MAVVPTVCCSAFSSMPIYCRVMLNKNGNKKTLIVLSTCMYIVQLVGLFQMYMYAHDLFL